MRKEAIEWWNNEPTEVRDYFSQIYYDRDWLSLTGREIEAIYKEEFAKDVDLEFLNRNNGM